MQMAFIMQDAQIQPIPAAYLKGRWNRFPIYAHKLWSMEVQYNFDTITDFLQASDTLILKHFIIFVEHR